MLSSSDAHPTRNTAQSDRQPTVATGKAFRVIFM